MSRPAYQEKKNGTASFPHGGSFVPQLVIVHVDRECTEYPRHAKKLSVCAHQAGNVRNGEGVSPNLTR